MLINKSDNTKALKKHQTNFALLKSLIMAYSIIQSGFVIDLRILSYIESLTY